jgi:hypothetical protein
MNPPSTSRIRNGIAGRRDCGKMEYMVGPILRDNRPGGVPIRDIERDNSPARSIYAIALGGRDDLDIGITLPAQCL